MNSRPQNPVAGPTERLRGETVVVAGGLGFIGLNLTAALLRAGARVRIINRTAKPQARRWLEQVDGGHAVELVEGDIGDVALLAPQVADATLVINLAGESGAAKSLREAQRDTEVNVLAQIRLLDTIRETGNHPRLVFVSSRLVYGITGAEAASEAHPTRPTSLYGLHKLTVEHYYRLYWEHHGIPYTALRVTNPYGPYQLPERVQYGIVNRFVMAALAGETLPLFGGGRQLRDYLFVTDLVDAILLGATLDAGIGQTFNVGSGLPTSLREVSQLIVELAGSGRVEVVPWPDSDRKVETGDFVCDTSRIARLLGWQCGVPLREGLARTVEAYRALVGERRAQ